MLIHLLSTLRCAVLSILVQSQIQLLNGNHLHQFTPQFAIRHHLLGVALQTSLGCSSNKRQVRMQSVTLPPSFDSALYPHLCLTSHVSFLLSLPMPPRLRTKPFTTRAAILRNRRAKTRPVRRGEIVLASQAPSSPGASTSQAPSVSSPSNYEVVLRVRIHRIFQFSMSELKSPHLKLLLLAPHQTVRT
jgi:hypothetical protein